MKKLLLRVNRNNIILRYIIVGLLAAVILLSLVGCGDEESLEITKNATGEESSLRDNTPVVLTPEFIGNNVIGNESVSIDISNSSEGYVMVDYHGDASKVKLKLKGVSNMEYTYDIPVGITTIPLTDGSCEYHFIVFECISGTQYATLFDDYADITIENEYGPYLYPNQRVNFNSNSRAVALAKDLAANATCDIEVVYSVYEYVSDNIKYDHDKAENIQSGYLPDIDSTLNSKTGICYDYASLMAAMLRSQRIPTRLEIGYAGDAYHAWISVFIEDIGWINGMIEFDGLDWSLMDPTFAANSGSAKLKEFIGDGNNYATVLVY